MSASFTITGFEVLEKLGEGGMAAVWKARQISLDRTVAIKILSDRLAADATDIDRFQTEARAAAKLKHPGIVQVYDASAEGGMYYFVMEYVAGYTVGEWVRRKGRLSEKEALLVAECVADALSYAWEREHIVHCDIKPDNIMVDEDGTVKVADLGLARTISAMNADDDCDEVMGTPAYISPEQAQGLSDLDCRSDIYSLGATLYHLLTGKMLFEGHEQEEIMELQLTSTVPDPMDEVPSLSKGVCWLLERMLCKDRELRESAWEDVRRDIRRVSRGLLPQGKSIPDGASTIQRSQRRSVTAYQRQVRTQVVREATTTPVIKISVIGGLVALLLIIMVRGWLAHRSPPPVQAEPSIPEIRYIERNTEPVEREDPVERRARDMHEHARRYEEGHPDQIEAAIALYERVLAETQGTKYSLMAQTSVTRLNAARDRAARQVLDELQHRAEQLAASGDTQGAIALLRAYNGPYAEHTRRERGGLVTQISLHAQERERTDRERQEALVLARDHTLTALADQIAGQDLAGALLAVDHAASSFAEIAADPEWQSLRTVLRDAVQLDDRIINSFARQAGQTVTVEFNAGPRQVVVEAVEDGRVRCRQLVGSDRMIHSTVTFGLEQLALRERLQRMGSDDDMDVALVKGMLALEAEAFDHAVRFFEKTHALLAQRLVEATGDARQARAERLAESGLRDLLRFCGITVGDFSRAEWLRQVESHAFNPAHMEPIGAAVNAYLQAHGETDFAAAAKAILDVLRGRTDGQDHEPDVLPQPRGAPPGRHPGRRTSAAARQEIGTEAVLAALRAGNPQARPDAFVAEEENGVCVKLSINDSQVTNIDPVAGLSELKTVHFEGQPGALARLRSLRPIAQLPLESVAIRYAAIRDIYELRGMSLTYVDLTGSAVRDLNALRGSPVQELRVGGTRITDLMVAGSLTELQHLDASGTSVTSGMPLADMPIRHLNLSNTRVLDFSFVRRLPRLEQLLINDCSIRSLSGLVSPSLRVLSINNTRIDNLAPLAGSGLTGLHIAGTPVRDFSPLKGLRLQQLNLAGTSIATLDLLDGMPLTYLDISRTRVTSLEPLAGMKLTSLHLSGSAVESLRPLHGMAFHTLNIRDIPARDLTPLRGASIRRLWMSRVEENLEFIRSLRNLDRINGRDIMELATR